MYTLTKANSVFTSHHSQRKMKTKQSWSSYSTSRIYMLTSIFPIFAIRCFRKSAREFGKSSYRLCSSSSRRRRPSTSRPSSLHAANSYTTQKSNTLFTSRRCSSSKATLQIPASCRIPARFHAGCERLHSTNSFTREGGASLGTVYGRGGWDAWGNMANTWNSKHFMTCTVAQSNDSKNATIRSQA